MITNKIGLEAEFLLLRDGCPVFPKNYGFPTDSVELLAECRGLPGQNLEETVSNFQKELIRLRRMARRNNLEVYIGEGWRPVDPALWQKVLKASAAGKLESLLNERDIESIYGENLEEYSDQEIEDGKLKAVRVSCGLHVHFSSSETVEVNLRREKMLPVSLPLSSAGIETTVHLFRQAGYEEEVRQQAHASRITNPVIRYMVEALDRDVHSVYPSPVPLRHRRPGLFRRKDYGFEYRSLPFDEKVLANLDTITERAFSLLEKL